MERAICIFWIHYKGGAAIISHDTNPYYPSFWCHQCTHHYWVEDNLMGSSSVVTQWEKRGRGKEWRTGREVRGLCSMWNIKRPSTLFMCACVCVCCSVYTCAALPHHSPKRQKPCCDLCSLRYECWLRSSKTSIWQSKPNNKEARKMMCPVEWRNGECTYKS